MRELVHSVTLLLELEFCFEHLFKKQDLWFGVKRLQHSKMFFFTVFLLALKIATKSFTLH